MRLQMSTGNSQVTQYVFIFVNFNVTKVRRAEY